LDCNRGGSAPNETQAIKKRRLKNLITQEVNLPLCQGKNRKLFLKTKFFEEITPDLSTLQKRIHLHIGVSLLVSFIVIEKMLGEILHKLLSLFVGKTPPNGEIKGS
tara:strand:+ start:181 stop:498 length:318 start_codon:yes stop_codon:yes gene_type:complete